MASISISGVRGLVLIARDARQRSARRASSTARWRAAAAVHRYELESPPTSTPTQGFGRQLRSSGSAACSRRARPGSWKGSGKCRTRGWRGRPYCGVVTTRSNVASAAAGRPMHTSRLCTPDAWRMRRASTTERPPPNSTRSGQGGCRTPSLRAGMERAGNRASRSATARIGPSRQCLTSTCAPVDRARARSWWLAPRPVVCSIQIRPSALVASDGVGFMRRNPQGSALNGLSSHARTVRLPAVHSPPRPGLRDSDSRYKAARHDRRARAWPLGASPPAGSGGL